MMQVMESVDKFYVHLQKAGIPNWVQEAQLVRMLLDKLDGKYDEYLEMNEDEQMKYALVQFLNGVISRIPSEMCKEK
jgi:Fe-S oxidoreductase